MLRGHWVGCRSPCAKPCGIQSKRCRLLSCFKFQTCTLKTFFVSVLSCKHGRRRSGKVRRGNESGMCKAALVGDARRGCSVGSRSGACSFNRLSTRKLTRSRHFKDFQIHSIFSVSDVPLESVNGLAEAQSKSSRRKFVL